MQLAVNRAVDSDAPLAVVCADILDADSAFGVQGAESLEANASRFPIPDTLGFVEFDRLTERQPMLLPVAIAISG